MCEIEGGVFWARVEFEIDEKTMDKAYYLENPRLISYCRAEGSYTWINYIEGKKELLCMTIGDFEKKLDSDFYIRCHRSYIVNIEIITKLDIFQRLIYISNVKIPVSRRKFNNVILKCYNKVNLS